MDNNNKFPNQTRDPITAVYEDKEMYFGENDTQPEPYFAEDRENVDFDNFTGFAKSVKKLYNLFWNFQNNVNPFFGDIVWLNVYRSRKENKSKRKR